MRLHQRSAHLLPLLLLVLLLPVRGETAGEAGPRLACAPSPQQETSFANKNVTITSLVAMGEAVFFASSEASVGATLWKATQDANGDVVTTSLYFRAGGDVRFSRLTVAQQRLYFVVTTGGLNPELWASDEMGTRGLKIFSDSALSNGERFAVMGGTLFFMAGVSDTGAELWRSDGTAESTQLVHDIKSGPEPSTPNELTVLGGELFFRAEDGSMDVELWKSDGVPNSNGTQRVKDIWTAGSSNPGSLRVIGDKLYFTATPTLGAQSEIWESDGKPEGTQVAVPFEQARNHGPLESLTVAGDKLFFSMDDQEGHGQELWVSTGRPEGTRIVKDLKPGQNSSGPELLTAVGQTLFFMASDTETGRELWKTDGTEAGTVLVKDFISGPSSSLGGEVLVSGGGGLLVSIDDGVSGKQLWRINRTGAEQLTTIGTAPDGSNPHSMTVAGDRLYFVATYPSVGEELVSLPLGEVDCVPPTRVCPEDLHVEAVNSMGAHVNLPPPKEMSDDSLTPLTVRYRSAISGELPSNAGDFQVGATSVTITVEDAAKNSAECTLIVTVEDRTAPALVCPRQLVREATGPLGANVSYPVQALDAVTESPEVSYSHASGSFFALDQEVEVRATATDEKNNSSTCDFKVVVKDTVPPALTCPQSVVHVATSAEPVSIPYPQLQATDVVTLTPRVEADRPSGSLFEVGEWPVTLTAVDAAGNQSQCTFTVYNLDAVAPTLTCPGPQQALATEPEGVAVHFPAAEPDDDLAPPLPTVRYTHEPGSTFPVGETIVTATASDLGGNEVSCSFPVTVVERSGCGCQSGSASASLFWLALALVPLWARRRAGRLAG
ncbi:HYR domain-containing protein [Hyalangium sp.]|uniref:HYR domain-containing protein n=1 Tax=Hyalangium sp. TaxID=2028555 RepID=UPI002D689EF7|nr:HYR domain-containing protein [Hyalangium sp.]HYH96953.1 HYR domain-containing protein [Hyalangium sp.]